MFQLEKRSTTLTYNDQERAVINERIQAYQESKDIAFSSVKELFSAMLADVLTMNAPTGKNTDAEIIVKTEEIKAAFAEQIQGLDNEIMRLTDANRELTLEIEGLQNQPAGIQLQQNQEIISLSPEIANKVEQFKLECAMHPEVSTAEILSAAIDMATMEIELPESPTFDIAFNLTENENKMTEAIIANRRRKFGNKIPEQYTKSQLVHDMVFNEAVLGNWHGAFYTGF